MQLEPHVEALRADLAELAGLGDEATAAAAARLSTALKAATGLRFLGLLGEAALEVSAQLPAGHVHVRLSGTDAELVYVAEAADEPAAGEEPSSARITLRLPEGLKASVETAAAREGMSVNTWLVRALSRAVSGPPPAPRSSKRLTGFARS
ncbi:MAG: toxin-antitoxin system HicB family antitoxin [Gaiellaceae bacterium]